MWKPLKFQWEKKEIFKVWNLKNKAKLKIWEKKLGSN